MTNKKEALKRWDTYYRELYMAAKELVYDFHLANSGELWTYLNNDLTLFENVRIPAPSIYKLRDALLECPESLPNFFNYYERHMSSITIRDMIENKKPSKRCIHGLRGLLGYSNNDDDDFLNTPLHSLIWRGEELLAMKSIGKKTVAELEDVLSEYNLELFHPDLTESGGS